MPGVPNLWYGYPYSPVTYAHYPANEDFLVFNIGCLDDK